jgi:hypothetical protein
MRPRRGLRRARSSRYRPSVERVRAPKPRPILPTCIGASPLELALSELDERGIGGSGRRCESRSSRRRRFASRWARKLPGLRRRPRRRHPARAAQKWRGFFRRESAGRRHQNEMIVILPFRAGATAYLAARLRRGGRSRSPPAGRRRTLRFQPSRTPAKFASVFHPRPERICQIGATESDHNGPVCRSRSRGRVAPFPVRAISEAFSRSAERSEEPIRERRLSCKPMKAYGARRPGFTREKRGYFPERPTAEPKKVPPDLRPNRKKPSATYGRTENPLVSHPRPAGSPAARRDGLELLGSREGAALDPPLDEAGEGRRHPGALLLVAGRERPEPPREARR